ncbi:restriction endonuclease subunit S [Avibacterium sp. 20-132]|uniref:restriction endonuclease subunit S n=1 Tax=Avibacterium sp. 20-132 TaxID=2911526 RepID=UPI0020271EAE|nr:restriction endonuclease subunit S [Avibacterium sp. 20-132]URL04913.1 restriction endonuclease subunit S [Avibacterium sp. 20-132]
MKNNNIPKIRFPEFTDAWEKCKLGDCGKIVAGGDVDKNKLKPKGKYPVLANALTNNGIIGFYDDYKHTSPAVTITGRGDIGYAIARETNFTAVVRLLVLKPKRYFDIFFLENSINLKQIYIESTGVPQLTVPQISQYEIPFPSLAEQQKIGTFFRQLDRLITLHKRKWDEVILLKKALLQKMFPKNGSDFPEIRFPEFTHAWEKCKLGEVANIFDNLRIPVTASERIIGTTPYYGANGIQDYVDGFTHQGEFVLIAEDGANDIKNYPCEYVEGKIWVNNHAHVLSGKKNILDNPFLTYRIKSMDISPYLVGGGRAKLNAKVMLKIELSVPTLPEQQKIGTFFRQLDTLITLHKRQHEHYQRLKKALLQQMFV